MLGTTLSLRSLLIAAGCTTLGAVAGLASAPRSTSYVTIATPRIVTVEKTIAPRPARASELLFVIDAGPSSYVKLATIGDGREIMPKHGAPTLYTEDGVESAIATVKTEDVPASYRVWLERRVRVESGCEAKVTGFAVLSRLSGSPAYAGEPDLEQWTAKTVFADGTAMLVGTLSGCTGTFARDVTLPPVVTPTEIADPTGLGDKARAMLLASPASAEAQKDWLEADQTGTWSDGAFSEIKVLRHPTTGVTWVSVHFWREFSCGDPEANVWGLFRVNADGSLVASQMRRMSDLTGIEQLIDVDGDGELELVGRPWLGVEQRIERANGDEIDSLELPYLGCPC